MKPTTRGRPSVVDDDDDATPAHLHLTLPARQYDELYERARQARVSVQEVIRRQLRPPNKKT